MPDAVVIGAGFAGLSAAASLEQAGLDVLLFEARDRVGGRVEALLNGLGERVDAGGQFFCEDMPEFTGLARSQGRAFVEPYARGNAIALPPLPPGAAPNRMWEQVGALRERMNALDPADSGLRNILVGDWVAAQALPQEVEASFLSLVTGLWCIDPWLLPLSFLVDNDRRITNEVSELQYFLSDSAASVAEEMAVGLRSTIRYGEPVLSVEQSEGSAFVRTAEDTVCTKLVVVAVPPVRAGKLEFQPALPEKLQRALNAWTSGAAAKVMLRYAEPFWRSKGLSGTVMSRDPSGLYVCETSVDTGHAGLVVFVAGPTLLQWRTEGDAGLRTRALAHVAAALGPEGMHPLDVLVRDWTNDRWSGGAYADVVTDLNMPDAEDILREGWGRVQLASSELASSFPGYIEGAIVAGREAATRVLAAGQSVARER